MQSLPHVLKLFHNQKKTNNNSKHVQINESKFDFQNAL